MHARSAWGFELFRNLCYVIKQSNAMQQRTGNVLEHIITAENPTTSLPSQYPFLITFWSISPCHDVPR